MSLYHNPILSTSLLQEPIYIFRMNKIVAKFLISTNLSIIGCPRMRSADIKVSSHLLSEKWAESRDKSLSCNSFIIPQSNNDDNLQASVGFRTAGQLML